MWFEVFIRLGFRSLSHPSHSKFSSRTPLRIRDGKIQPDLLKASLAQRLAKSDLNREQAEKEQFIPCCATCVVPLVSFALSFFVHSEIHELGRSSYPNQKEEAKCVLPSDHFRSLSSMFLTQVGGAAV